MKQLSLSVPTVALLLLLATGNSTAQEVTTDLTADFQTITVTNDIPYREGESDAWKLDLAIPANFTEGLRPAIVVVHGDGWASGSKNVDVFHDMKVSYAHQGYVAINVDYRLTGEADFPACIEDVKYAVRRLRAHAEDLRVDPDRIGAYGHSASAHLALMLAMTADEEMEGDGSYREYSSLVNLAVGGSPPTELGRDVPMADPAIAEFFAQYLNPGK